MTSLKRGRSVYPSRDRAGEQASRLHLENRGFSSYSSGETDSANTEDSHRGQDAGSQGGSQDSKQAGQETGHWREGADGRMLWIPPPPHAHTLSHAHAHALKHAHMQTLMYTLTQAHTPMHTLSHMHTRSIVSCACTLTHTHMHTLTHAHTHNVHSLTHMHTHTHRLLGLVNA